MLAILLNEQGIEALPQQLEYVETISPGLHGLFDSRLVTECQKSLKDGLLQHEVSLGQVAFQHGSCSLLLLS